MRTIVLANNTDWVYCKFVDDENFVEYYNLTGDPWQLQNMARQGLMNSTAMLIEARLSFLRSCSGSSCHGGMFYRWPNGTVTDTSTASSGHPGGRPKPAPKHHTRHERRRMLELQKIVAPRGSVAGGAL